MPAYLLFLGLPLAGEGPPFSPLYAPDFGERSRSLDDLIAISPAALEVGSCFRDLELLAGFSRGLFLILI